MTEIVRLTAQFPNTDPFVIGRQYLVLKHQETGELLGTSALGHIPTRVVLAIRTKDGWQEVSP